MSNTVVAAEQKAEIKQKVKEKLKELGVDKQIQELVTHKVQPSVAPKSAKQEAIAQLKGRGVIEQLVKSLVPPTIARTATEEKRHRHAIHLKIKGVADLGFYRRKPPEPLEQLVVCGELYGQRFRSTPVPAGVTAPLEAAFSVDLPRAVQSAEQVLLQRQLLHLVLLRTFPHIDASGRAVPDTERYNLESEVLGTASYDWREALHSPGQSLACCVDLGISGSGIDGLAAVGTLELEIQEHSMGSCQIDRANIKARQRGEQEVNAAAVQRFKTLAAVAEAESGGAGAGSSPPRRLLAEGEDGALYPVCCFVRPLQLGRSLATPQEACHFVSLIEARLEWDTDVWDGPIRHFWASLHTILSAGLATPEEKALLLCSLVQGFGTEAFVACGTHKSNPAERRLWVVTRPTSQKVLFWDPVSGHRSDPGQLLHKKPCPFLTVDHLFNHRSIFINRQPVTASVSQTSFALEDADCWLEIAVHSHDLAVFPLQRFDLQRQPVDVAALEVRLEASIKQLLAAHRAGSVGSAGTAWDDSLAFLLMPALAAFEHDAVWGQSGGFGEDFQNGIRRGMPAGCTFKGCTHHSRCLVAPRIVRALLRDASARDILLAPQTDAVFALRVRVIALPEHVYSLWLMLASRTQCVEVMPSGDQQDDTSDIGGKY